MPCFSASLLSHRSGRGAAALLTPHHMGGQIKEGAMPPHQYQRIGVSLAVSVVTADRLMLLLHGADPAGQGVETDKAFRMALVIHFIGTEGGEVF